MDYTKDAVLIEAMKSLEDIGTTSSPQRNFENSYINSGKLHHPHSHHHHHHSQQFGTFSAMALLNTSEYIERNVKTGEQANLSPVLLMKGNGSLSFPSTPDYPSTSLPPVLEGSQYDDMMNDTMEYIPMSMRPETYIVPVLFAIIFIIGVIGNGTLIVIFIKHRSMRNVPNMFIVSLAIGDLLVILFCVPFTSTVYTVDSWPYGLVVCKFSEFIKDLSVGVSVFTLTALSADRYFAIVDPMRKLTGRRATRITIISIIGIWILSILVALPSALYSYVRVFPEVEEGEEEDEEFDDGRTFQVCYPYPTEFGPTYAQVMVMFHFLVYYAVPLFFIATFYIIMARHLVLSTRNMPGEAQGQAKQIQARKKVAKMILSFVVIFAICFFPHHLFLLWFYFYPDSENSFNAFWNICRIVGFCLSFMNSCINPITLYCVSGTFRKQFNDHLFCCFCDESGNRPARGGRLSMGGTLVGGGHGGGLCAGCVSLSGNQGQLYGNDSRYGNGSLGRGGANRMNRSNWENSDRMMSKRKSTWETQTTVVNHRVLNINNGTSVANIHVNLCSEHEHIPLRPMNVKAAHYRHKAASTAVETTLAQGTTTIIADVQQNGVEDDPHNDHYGNLSAASSSTALLSGYHVQGHKYEKRNSSSSYSESARSKLNFNSMPDSVTNHNEASDVITLDGGTTNSPAAILVDNTTGDKSCEEKTPNNHQQQFTRRKSRPSLIEEETSVSEHEKSSNKSSRQHSPNKMYSTKVGEIFSKISSRYSNSSSSSPSKIFSGENSSPSKKSPTKVAPTSTPGLLQTIKTHRENDDDGIVVLNFNNNNYSNRSNNAHNYSRNVVEDGMEESMDECTVTSLIVLPENSPMGADLVGTPGKVIKCYN